MIKATCHSNKEASCLYKVMALFTRPLFADFSRKEACFSNIMNSMCMSLNIFMILCHTVTFNAIKLMNMNFILEYTSMIITIEFVMVLLPM